MKSGERGAKTPGVTRTIWSVLGNSQRLDGGAMFGNVPRALWQRWTNADEENRIPLACRALLIRDEERLVLCETGIGAFFAPALRERFGVVESEHVLLANLRAIGVDDRDIDVVVLSHLHFDHAGGLLEPYREGEDRKLRFERATFVVSESAWERAKHPHARDRASFIEELPALLEASGRLEVVKEGARSSALGGAYRLRISEGHTPGLLLTEVPSDDGPIVFASDLVPGRAWVHLPITMGYDRFPERLIDEKRELFEDLVARRGRLFFTHDHEIAMARIEKDERGRFVAGESWASPAGLVI